MTTWTKPIINIGVAGARGENLYDTVRRLGLGGCASDATDAEAALAYADYVGDNASETILGQTVVARDAAETAAASAGADLWSRPVSPASNTPPPIPTIGDRNLIGTSPTGAWASYANQVAEYFIDGWHFSGTPTTGQIVFVGTDVYMWTGSAWQIGLKNLTINGSVSSGGTGNALTVIGTSSGGSTYTRMYTGVFEVSDTPGDTDGHVVAVVGRAYTENDAADHDLLACFVAQAKFKEYAVAPGSFGYRVEYDDPVNYPGRLNHAFVSVPGIAAIGAELGAANVNADGTAKQSDGQIIRLHSVNGSLTNLYGQIFTGYDGTINLNPDANGTKKVAVNGDLAVVGDMTVLAGAAGSTNLSVDGTLGLGATINYDTALSATKPIYSFWYEGGSGIGHPAANTMSGIIQSVEVWRTDANGFSVTGVIKPKTYTVATLPNAATVGAGARAEVSDAAATPAWGGTATGGGAVQAPVRSSGSAWLYG